MNLEPAIQSEVSQKKLLYIFLVFKHFILYWSVDPDLPPVDPQAWDNEALLIARHHSHIQVFLKNPSQVITQTQYSLTTESRQGLKPIIS